MSSPPSLSSAAIKCSDDIPDDSPYHHEHIGPSLSHVRSFDKSHNGNFDQIAIPDMYQPTEVTGEPPCLLALVRDQGNSHKNAEAAAPGSYNNDGQAPSYGSIENRNQNSKPSGGYDGYDLPRSINDVAPRKTSHTWAADDDEQDLAQPYSQMSVTGRKIKNIGLPVYYSESSDKHAEAYNDSDLPPSADLRRFFPERKK